MKKDSRYSMTISLITVSIILFLAGSSHALNGTITPVTFTGPITKKAISFNIYLPAGYGSGTTRFPVIYNLHGNGGSQYSDNTVLPPALEAAIATGIIGLAIIVFPNGYGNTMWADSWDMTKPAETNVIREEIPYVDTHYRTIRSREARVIMGMSMGGFGCLDYGFKFPDTFCCAVSHAAAIDDNWFTADRDHPGIFNADSAYFEKYSPWTNLKLNANSIRSSVGVRIVCGTADHLLPYNQAMRDTLAGRNIPVSYAEVSGIGHDLNGLMSREGNNDFDFIARHLSLRTTRSLTVKAPPALQSKLSLTIASQEIRAVIDKTEGLPAPQLDILDVRGRLVERLNPEIINSNWKFIYRVIMADEQRLSAGSYIFAVAFANGRIFRQAVLIP